MLKDLLGNMKSVLKETFPMAKSNTVADKSLKTAVKSLKVIQWNTVVIEKVFIINLHWVIAKSFWKLESSSKKQKKFL